MFQPPHILCYACSVSRPGLREQVARSLWNHSERKAHRHCINAVYYDPIQHNRMQVQIVLSVAATMPYAVYLRTRNSLRPASIRKWEQDMQEALTCLALASPAPCVGLPHCCMTFPFRDSCSTPPSRVMQLRLVVYLACSCLYAAPIASQLSEVHALPQGVCVILIVMEPKRRCL